MVKDIIFKMWYLNNRTSIPKKKTYKTKETSHQQQQQQQQKAPNLQPILNTKYKNKLKMKNRPNVNLRTVILHRTLNYKT